MDSQSGTPPSARPLAPVRSILVIFRKPAGGFSIEGSFNQMLDSFDGSSAGLEARRFESTHPSRGLWPRLRAMREVRGQRADLYHITGDVHFLALALPRRRTILTVHDCHFLQNVRSRIGRWLLQKVWLDWPVAHSSIITAISTATRDQIVALTGCSPDKIVVIPTVISAAYVPAARVFHAGCPTVLHIGVGPQKNLERHVEALAGLSCRLRIVGEPTPAQLHHLERHGIDFEVTGPLDDAAMLRAYRDSDVVLFASLREGFGMPILEAQATGRVVVTSRLSPMAEVAGGAACLVDPTDVASIRAGVERVITDVAWREQLIADGFRNAGRFSAARVAGSYRDLYQRALAGQGTVDAGFPD